MQNTKRRRRVSWYIVWAFIFFILILSVLSVVVNLSVWKISAIEVSGAKIVSREHLAGLAKPLIGENIFIGDYSGLDKALRAVAQIKDYGLLRRLPSTVVIRVVERKPFAVVNISGSSIVIDDEGVFLKVEGGKSFKADYSHVSVSDISSLPVIRGIDLRRTSGARLSDDAARSIRISIGELSRFLPPSNLQLEMKDMDDMNLLVEDVLRVRFGDTESIAEKIRVLEAILPRIVGSWSDVDYIDIRAMDLPVIRYKKSKNT
jgi:cell division protein FtsQ